jgi:hypothetical protein
MFQDDLGMHKLPPPCNKALYITPTYYHPSLNMICHQSCINYRHTSIYVDPSMDVRRDIVDDPSQNTGCIVDGPSQNTG